MGYSSLLALFLIENFYINRKFGLGKTVGSTILSNTLTIGLLAKMLLNDDAVVETLSWALLGTMLGSILLVIAAYRCLFNDLVAE